MKFSGRAKFLILLSTEWPSLQLIKTISKGGTYNEIPIEKIQKETDNQQ